jgi:putative ABC transport system substrate-binding protein
MGSGIVVHRRGTVRGLPRWVPLALGLVWAALLAGPALAQAAQAPVAAGGDWREWFTLLPKVAGQWEVAPATGPGKRIEIRHKGDYPAGATVKSVVVLFAKKSSAYDTAMAKILDIFEEKKIPASFTVVNFESNPELGREVLDTAQRRGRDLLYSMGSDSTTFVHEHLRGARIPVVSVCSKDPVQMGLMPGYESGSGTNIAYTSLDAPTKVQMAYLLEFRPKLKTIAVLYDRKNVSAVTTQVEPLRKLAAEHNIRMIDVAVEDPKKAKEELARRMPEAVERIRRSDPSAENTVFWITGSTEVFREIATINKHSWKIPVLSAVPDVVKEGPDSALLSIGVSFESNAHLAAIYGVRILRGEVKPADLKVGVVSPPDIALNFYVARENGIKVPFNFIESANFVYNPDGRLVRENGLLVTQR